jgi:L,D-transpeptidase ErfK/SrfK
MTLIRRDSLRLVLVVLLLFFPATLFAADPGIPAGEVAVIETTYTVRSGDILLSIAGRFALDAATLARDNALDPSRPLRVGQTLKIVSRHIVPATLPDGIVVNIPQRTLFLFEKGRLVGFFGIGPGRAAWPTTLGDATVITRKTDPVWVVPRSIQEEMRAKGQPVIERMPPGPENPLGRYWLGLSITNLGIHGTNAPASIYHFRSHGCIRMNPEDISTLFSRVRINTPVRILYEPVLVARDAEGRLLLEAHPDVYRRQRVTPADVWQRLTALDPGTKPDPTQIEAILKTRSGVVTPLLRP